MEQYNLIYNALMQGKAISNHDLSNLKAFGQLMTNYQNNAEGYLTQSGLGADFFASQKLAFDQHFKLANENQPLPTLTESYRK